MRLRTQRVQRQAAIGSPDGPSTARRSRACRYRTSPSARSSCPSGRILRANPGASRSESGRDVANDDAIYSESRHDVARAVAINSVSGPGGVGGGRAPNLIATLHMCSFETVSLFLKFALRSKLPPSSTNDCRRRRHGAESCRDGRAGGARGSDGPTQSGNRGKGSKNGRASAGTGCSWNRCKRARG